MSNDQDNKSDQPKKVKRRYTRKAVNGKGPFSHINSESMHLQAIHGDPYRPSSNYWENFVQGSGLTLIPRND